MTPEHEKGGAGMKPHDKWTIPLCEFHHSDQTQVGEARFQKKHALDMGATAMNFARLSPHKWRWEQIDD
jgi:hypothetical protein